MFNRVRHFLKTITFNSGLNREKFINNKKKLIKLKIKNSNMMIRKMTTYTHPFDNKNKW